LRLQFLCTMSSRKMELILSNMNKQPSPNLSAKLPQKLKNDFKAKASKQGKQITEVLIKLITKYLKS